MFKVMVMLQTNGGSITREVGAFGGKNGLQRAESFKAYWMEQPRTLIVWID